MALSQWLKKATKLSQKLDVKRQSIIAKIENNPYYRFQSAMEIEIASQLNVKIDVNKATVDDWLRLPHISIHQAKLLVKLTDSGLQFLCLEDLATVLNLNPTKIIFWQPILSFCYYDQASIITPQKIDINRASFQELLNISFISSEFAEKIIKDREKNGNFQDLAHFKQRLSLNSDFVYQLMNYLKFN